MWGNKRSKDNRRALDEAGSFATVIGPEAVCVGDFKGSDNVCVNGKVRGKCDIRGALMLGESGQWTGNVVAEVVVVDGTVKGELRGSNKIELRAKARVKGDLASPVIAIEAGATFDGEMHMEKEAQVTNFQERRGAAAEPAPTPRS